MHYIYSVKRKLAAALLLIGMAVSVASAVDVDGKILPGEYAREESFDKGSFKLLWRIVGEKIFMAIDSEAKGWVSIGFEPSRIMANSDMVFGFVEASGVVKAVDAWSTGMFGPHPADVDQGGKDSILSFAGLRTGNRVVFEFSRDLVTGDKSDKPIPAKGALKIIWAYSQSMGFNAKHSKAGSATLDMSGSN